MPDGLSLHHSGRSACASAVLTELEPLLIEFKFPKSNNRRGA
jgi:hypothetical protein